MERKDILTKEMIEETRKKLQEPMSEVVSEVHWLTRLIQAMESSKTHLPTPTQRTDKDWRTHFYKGSV